MTRPGPARAAGRHGVRSRSGRRVRQGGLRIVPGAAERSGSLPARSRPPADSGPMRMSRTWTTIRVFMRCGRTGTSSISWPSGARSVALAGPGQLRNGRLRSGCRGRREAAHGDRRPRGLCRHHDAGRCRSRLPGGAGHRNGPSAHPFRLGTGAPRRPQALRCADALGLREPALPRRRRSIIALIRLREAPR